MSLNFIRTRFDKQLDSLGKEICIVFLGLFFLFITVSFIVNLNKNGYYLFFIISYGYLTIVLLVYSFNNLSKPHKDIEDKFIENNYIQNFDLVTNVLINGISQNNFTENNYINNLEFVTNNFIKKFEDKSKDKSKKADEFDIELKHKLIKIVEDLKIIRQKDFVILLLFVEQKEYPLKNDTWLVENFNSIFNIDITEQYVGQIRNTELKIFNKEVEFTRAQKKSYELFERIKSHFIDKNE